MTTGAQTGRGRFAAIVLAAGAGRRFGGGKLLARYGDGVLLDGAHGAAFALAPEVIVVTGTGAAAVAEAARQAHGQVGGPSRLTIVHAADHAEGMGASLRTGAKALPPDLAGVFILLGDMPRIPRDVGQRLAQALGQGAWAAAPAFQGRRGHPVLVGPELAPRLAEAQGDEGLRGLLAGLGPRLALIETDDEGVLFDVDRPQDLAP